MRRHVFAGVVARALVVIAAALLATGCVGPLAGDGGVTSCDGIDARLGGCDPDRPAYAGDDCEEVGREAGQQLNDRLLSIYGGPDSKEESRAVRASHATTLVIVLANLHLRQKGLIKDCGVDAFLVAAESQFSDELRRQAGTYLDDGDPVPYSVWLADLRKIVQIIDMEEDAPVDPTASPA